MKNRRQIQARRVGVRKPIVGFRLDPALVLRIKALASDRRTSAAAVVARALQREVSLSDAQTIRQ